MFWLSASFHVSPAMSVALQDANRHNAGLQSPNTKGVKSPARLGHAQRTPKKHGGGVLAVANNRMREQATPGRNFSGNLSMNGANVPPPLVVESQRYEEWMKIATDNVCLSRVRSCVYGADTDALGRKSPLPTPGTLP